MVIIVERSGGRTRVCGSRCHFAKSDICDCVCRGRYHQAGARAQTALLEDLPREQRHKQKKGTRRTINPAALQLSLLLSP